LAKGFLPYGQVFADKLGKVYTVTPSFRKEQTSKRHLTEYWRTEVVQHCDLENIMRVQEELIAHICSSLASEFKETLEGFNRSCSDLAKVRKPFRRLTYDEAIDMLQKDGYTICWGQEIGWELEQHLSLKFDKPFFIWKYPYSSETFFSKPDPEKPELSLYADLLAPEGYGEIASSLQMITEKEKLLQLMKEAGLNNNDQIWFLRFTQSCSEPCSGFAIGIERMLQWICKLSNIKKATAFPRLPDNIYP
jgi:asparaginyl-tRNA synthetase